MQVLQRVLRNVVAIAETDFDKYSELLSSALQAMFTVKRSNSLRRNLARVFFTMNINVEMVG